MLLELQDGLWRENGPQAGAKPGNGPGTLEAEFRPVAEFVPEISVVGKMNDEFLLAFCSSLFPIASLHFAQKTSNTYRYTSAAEAKQTVNQLVA